MKPTKGFKNFCAASLLVIAAFIGKASATQTQMAVKIGAEETASAQSSRQCSMTVFTIEDGRVLNLHVCKIESLGNRWRVHVNLGMTPDTDSFDGRDMNYLHDSMDKLAGVTLAEVRAFLEDKANREQDRKLGLALRHFDSFSLLDSAACQEIMQKTDGSACPGYLGIIANTKPWKQVDGDEDFPVVFFRLAEVPHGGMGGTLVAAAPHAHYAWFYPSSCVTLPENAGSEKIKELTDTIDALRKSTQTKTVYVYLLGFADRQESHASEARQEDERNYNLIVSRARVLAWKKLLEGKYGGKGQHPWLHMASYWFGQDYDNEQQKATWWPDEANPYKRLLVNGQSALDYNRRVEIIVSSGPNPPAAAGWVQAWNQGNYRVSDDGRDGTWRKYKSGSRRLIKTDQNVSLKALAAVEDGLRGFDSSLVDPEDSQP